MQTIIVNVEDNVKFISVLGSESDEPGHAFECTLSTKDDSGEIKTARSFGQSLTEACENASKDIKVAATNDF
jgi:hypothetical protein